MAAWCLPSHLSNAFLDAIKDGTLSPENLMAMSSVERRAEFAKIVGDENAHEVNAQFESKMLLNDFKKGLVNWANKIAGLSEPVRRDILATINRLDRVLQPEEERDFLADLAAKKLGVTVTADEAREIFQLSQAAEAARTQMLKGGSSDLNRRMAYGRAYLDLRDKIESLKPYGRTFGERLLNVLSLSKPMLTSVMHLSAMGVQGWGMISTKVAWKGFGEMLQYFGSEDHFRDLEAYIISHPDYELAKDGKLGITKLGDKLSAREESIQSTILEDANGWLAEKTGAPNLVRASSRAFTGYLNYVRFNRFVDLLNAARLGGEDVRAGSQAVKDLANVVNDFTGRANLGKDDKFSSAGPLLNATFFAPRKIVATMQMFNPVRYLDPRISKTARSAAMRQLTGSILATGSILWLAKSMGAQVSFEPKDADFGKIVIGGEKFDLTGGNAGYIRLLGRLITGESENAHGKVTELGDGYKATTRADLTVQWLRGKLAPLAGMIADGLYGSDEGGRPFSIGQELRDRLMPITMSSWLDMAMNNPDDAAAYLPALSAMFGIGMESPAPPITTSGLDAWGEHLDGPGTPKSWRADPVNLECEKLGYTPRPPADNIRSVKLTQEQYADYTQTAGRLAHMRLSSMVGTPWWGTLPAATRLSMVKDVVRKNRDVAASGVIAKSLGSANDIMRLAKEKKDAQSAALEAASRATQEEAVP